MSLHCRIVEYWHICTCPIVLWLFALSKRAFNAFVEEGCADVGNWDESKRLWDENMGNILKIPPTLRWVSNVTLCHLGLMETQLLSKSKTILWQSSQSKNKQKQWKFITPILRVRYVKDLECLIFWRTCSGRSKEELSKYTAFSRHVCTLRPIYNSISSQTWAKWVCTS